MAPFDHNPLDVVWEVLQSLFIRLVLFAATVIFGGWIGLHVPDVIPAGYALFWFGATLVALPMISLAVVMTLITTESTTCACFALAINILAWCWGAKALFISFAII